MQLTRVVTSLSKAKKDCVIKLSLTKVCFIGVESGVLGGISLWSEIQQNKYFDDYHIEGRDERNEIYLECNLEQLSRALKSAQNAQLLKIKLARKEGAILSIEVIQPTLSSTQRQLVHEVPVVLVPPRLWGDYQEPVMPDINVSIYLPLLKSIKTYQPCLLYTSPSPRDRQKSRMPSSA